MEQYNENIYVADLEHVNTAAEIIFELSSILDTDEAKNKRICLKLGNVGLNQAQLLSIKSLISGIESTLSSIETKSVETEKVALSLGIIVSNISEENSLDVAPEMTYKTAEEYKEGVNSQENQTESVQNDNIEEENESTYNSDDEIVEEIEQNSEPQINEAAEDTNNEETRSEEIKDNTDNGMQDELDVIFGSSPAKDTFMEMEASHSLYSEREELGELITPEPEYTKEDIELEAFPTKYIKQTLRSGQVINYEGNVVVIGDCHPGCEITAFGDITVWGVLGGIAHAGAGGNQKARVRALQMNAIQLRIANCYSRRPDSLNTIYAEKTNSFTPEEARIVNNEIVVFKIND